MTVATEERIPLAEAAKILQVSQQTVRTYCNHGVNGIRLEHIPRPRRFETSREAVERFLAALTVSGEVEEPVMAPSHADERAAFKAETEARNRLASSRKRSTKTKQSSGSV